ASRPSLTVSSLPPPPSAPGEPTRMLPGAHATADKGQPTAGSGGTSRAVPATPPTRIPVPPTLPPTPSPVLPRPNPAPVSPPAPAPNLGGQPGRAQVPPTLPPTPHPNVGRGPVRPGQVPSTLVPTGEKAEGTTKHLGGLDVTSEGESSVVPGPISGTQVKLTRVKGVKTPP